MQEIWGAARRARIDALRRKLQAREKNPAFRENCQMLREEISRLEKLEDGE